MNISTLLRAAPVGRRTALRIGAGGLLKAMMVDTAAHQAATSPLNLRPQPTERQAKAGNYAKGHTKVAGIPISIENPAGSRRRPDWAPLTAHYGYIRRTTGADGDHVDVFVRPSTANNWVGDVFVINQLAEGSDRFDEHKVMVGWPDERSAVRAYLGNYPRGWRLGPVVTMSSAEFRTWVREGDHRKPLRKYSDDQPRDEAGRWTSAGDESGAGDVKAGDKFVVYRLGQKNGDLDNRNAGNADAVAMHMVRMADETGAVSVGGVGDHVTAYEVTIGQSGVGPYEAHSAGHGGKETRVGRVVAGRSKNEVAYSFPKNGDFTARQLASVSVRDLNAKVGQGMNFDDAGSIRGAEILRDVFKPTKKVNLAGLLRKYSDDQPRDERGRWSDGGGEGGGGPSLETLFSDNLGFERANMPQVPAKFREAFVAELKAAGIEVKSETVSARSLKPTQKDYKAANIEHLRAEDASGNWRADARIMVSRDNRVLDGHHRWAFKAQDKQSIDIIRVDTPIRELLDRALIFNTTHGVERRTVKLSLGTLRKYSEDQPRDELGRWTDGGGGGSLAAYAAASYDEDNLTVESVLAKLSEADRKEIEATIAAVEDAPTTADIHMKDGDWSPERLELHDRIVGRILNQATIEAATPGHGEAPTFVVLGGRGGSGKSAFTDGRIKEFDSDKFVHLDTDAIKAMLPEYTGGNAWTVHDESSAIMSRVTKAAEAMGLNILHDSTLSSMGAEKTIDRLAGQGYKVEGHYMFLPRQVSTERAMKRYLGKGPGQRGRLVPPEVLLSMTKNERNFDALKSKFSKWSAYDNNVGMGQSAKLIDRGGA